MASVSVSRHVDAPPDAVREAMDDVVSFVGAGGFDEVTLDGDDLHIENRVGILTIELDLELVEGEGDVDYVQRDGIFETMTTTFTVEPDGDGSLVTGETAFKLDLALVGELLDSTVIKRQRRKELNGQFDWLEATATAN